MNLAEYYAVIAALPRPTEEQVENFAHHVCHAHSWYKHLPFDGAEFVVFIDPDAGGGFTEDHPRLHHTWESRSQYLEEFGHLSYMYRTTPSDEFTTDYDFSALVGSDEDRSDNEDLTPAPPLPSEIRQDCGFTLYPFARDHHVFFRRFQNQLRELSEGKTHHPSESLLIAYYRGTLRHVDRYVELSNEVEGRRLAGIPCRGRLAASNAAPTELDYWRAESEYIEDLARQPETRASLSESELACLLSAHEANTAEYALQEQERAKVSAALNRLMSHLDSAACAT